MNVTFPRAALAGLALALLTGCASMRVREIEKPAAEATLMVARSGEESTVSWMGQRGIRYTLLYADSRKAGSKWMPLPGVAPILGAGAMITIHDKVPAGKPRYYRLQVTPVSNRKP